MYRQFITLSLLLGSSAIADPALELNIDSHQITVSGISAGAQMAHQLHIAYPDVFSGVGIIAGGPFGCADGSLATALGRCMGKVDEPLPVAEFAAEIRSASKDGRTGEVAALADDLVWVFHGALDSTVAVEQSDAVVALYRKFIPADNIRYVNDIEAAHNFPTWARGNECNSKETPFIGNCDYDAAGELLQHLYGNLATPEPMSAYELSKVILKGATAAGLLETGYLYVPVACSQSGKACKIHLVLHGCAQSSTQIGTTFIEQSGYLPWAEANNIVLAFPQVAASPINPFACWDWWGYTGATYRWRDGAQMKVLTDWIQLLINP